MTWPQAAAMVGCPVPTIDWYTRQGRIERRPQRGRRPTLRRSSVEEFAVWWQERQAGTLARRAARAAGIRPGRVRDGRRVAGVEVRPVPAGWLSAAEAADLVGKSPGHIPWLIGRGHLIGRKINGRWWCDPDSVAAYAAKENHWISIVDAADLVGCSTSVILDAAHAGEIAQRHRGRATPSLNRESVGAFAARWRDQKKAAAAERERREQDRLRAGRPDTEHVWLTAGEAGELLGLSRSRVGQLADEERLPFTLVGRRRWFRRDHIEHVAAARVFARRFEELTS